MICSQKDLKVYLDADRIALGRKRKSPSLFDLIWKFEISLKKMGITIIVNMAFGGPVKAYHGFKLRVISILCGYEIPLNCIDKGLSIAHKGTIIINKYAHIGKNCRLHVGVNVSSQF